MKALRFLLGLGAAVALAGAALLLGFLLMGELAQLVHWMIKG